MRRYRRRAGAARRPHHRDPQRQRWVAPTPADVVAAFVGEAEIAPSAGESIELARSAAAAEDAVLVAESLFTVADAKRALQR